MPLPDSLRLLLETAVRLGRPTISWKLTLGRMHAHVEAELLLERDRARVMAELEDALPALPAPLSAKEVEAALREAWDEKPGDVLDALDGEPAHVTPTAQVHRAVLDGEPVAIKVLRPRLAEQLRSDLAIADALVRPAGAAFPAVDAAALLAEVRERVAEEYDLEHEASVQRAFHRRLRGHPRFVVPAPVTRLAGDRVLVSAWVDGSAPGASDAADLLGLWVGAARSGTIHADPELDHVRRLDDGRLAWLDFGATREVDAARVDLTERGLAALRAGDEDEFAAVAVELGWVDDDAVARRAFAVGRDLLAPFLDGPARLDVAALVAVRDAALDRIEELWEIARAGRIPPQDLWALRMAGQLVVTLARLGATEDWLALTAEALGDGWAARRVA